MYNARSGASSHGANPQHNLSVSTSESVIALRAEEQRWKGMVKGSYLHNSPWTHHLHAAASGPSERAATILNSSVPSNTHTILAFCSLSPHLLPRIKLILDPNLN
jgi:hypothetical protein